MGTRKRPVLSLSGSTSSVRASLVDSLGRPESPMPDRENFRSITGRSEVIIFDFDGTLTATPGDQQVRRRKREELTERSAMLRPKLEALKEAGAFMGIMSKSTQVTVTDALEAAQLRDLFEAPIVGKALSLEGKAGLIRDLARQGKLHRGGDRRSAHRILLVDDDLCELERAADAGLQTYAAPVFGGLTTQDFDAILESLRLPPSRPSERRPSTSGVDGSTRYSTSMTLFSTGHDTSLLASSKRPSGKWRNLILFAGDVFDG